MLIQKTSLIVLTLAFIQPVNSLLAYSKKTTTVIENPAKKQNPKNPPPRDGNRGMDDPLGDPEVACASTDPNKQAIALVPDNKQNQRNGFIQAPTIWFYISDVPKDINSVEFILHSIDGNEDLYRHSFTFPKTPGIVGVTLPASLANSLQLNEYYKWFLKINCSNASQSLNRSGWIIKLDNSSSNLVSNNVSPEIWYDKLTNIANRRLDNPNDEQLKSEWRELLESIDLERLAGEPLIAPVLLPEAK